MKGPEKMKSEIAEAAIKVTPPAAVVGWSWLWNVPLEVWLQRATLVYVLLQMFFLLKDRLDKRKSKKGGKK